MKKAERKSEVKTAKQPPAGRPAAKDAAKPAAPAKAVAPPPPGQKGALARAVPAPAVERARAAAGSASRAPAPAAPAPGPSVAAVRPAALAAVAPPPAAPPEGTQIQRELLDQVRVLRGMVAKLPVAPVQTAPPPELLQMHREMLDAVRLLRAGAAEPPAPAAGADPALERAADSLRRLLSELIEARTEGTLARLVSLRKIAASVTGPGSDTLLAEMDNLLCDLGAIRFDAAPLDYVDPLIHTIVAERQLPGAPDGVVAGTVRCGFRTARGVVLAKALVAVNRRS